MKRIISISFLFLSVLAFGQKEEYNFKPLWNKNEVKNISISHVETEYEDGILLSDTTMYNEARIKVLEVGDESYVLEVLLENQALLATVEFYDKLGEELEDYKDLKLIYSVNKQTADVELQNWEESQKFMNDSFEQITSILELKAPDIAPYIGLAFMPLEEIFKSKENVEAFMEENIGYILITYNKRFKLGETISFTDTAENPFSPMQEVSETTLLTLESVNETSKTCTINQKVELDLSGFNEMMKGMMSKMGKSVGASDSQIAEKAKEMDEFEMNLDDTRIITFDYETTWVTNVVYTRTVSGFDPQRGVKPKTERVTTIKIE